MTVQQERVGKTLPLTLSDFPAGAGSITIPLKAAHSNTVITASAGKLSLASHFIKDSSFVCGGFSNWKDTTVVFACHCRMLSTAHARGKRISRQM